VVDLSSHAINLLNGAPGISSDYNFYFKALQGREMSVSEPSCSRGW